MLTWVKFAIHAILQRLYDFLQPCILPALFFISLTPVFDFLVFQLQLWWWHSHYAVIRLSVRTSNLLPPLLWDLQNYFSGMQLQIGEKRKKKALTGAFKCIDSAFFFSSSPAASSRYRRRRCLSRSAGSPSVSSSPVVVKKCTRVSSHKNIVTVQALLAYAYIHAK